MTLNIAKEVAALEGLATLARCRPATPRSSARRPAGGNKAWLVRRIAWRLQALAEGDLSERAAAAPPSWPTTPTCGSTPPTGPSAAARERRTATSRPCGSGRRPALALPGTVLTRRYKGRRCRSRSWPTASSTRARSTRRSAPSPRPITGSHCNGFLFFRLAEQRR